MERVKTTQRPNMLKRFEELEFSWHEDYWDETAYWKFTAAQVDEIEAATQAIYAIALVAVGKVIADRELPFFGYSTSAIELIEESWKNRATVPSFYTRLDLAYDGGGPPKLLEINGDTPTSLYEAGVVQWDWLQSCFPDADQFNSVHDNLVEVLQKLAAKTHTTVHDDGDDIALFHTTSVPNHAEDEGTSWYINYLAAEQGLETKHVPIDRIGWRRYEAGMEDHYVDQDNLPIRRMFKLYPWEWLLNDQFGEHVHDEVLNGNLELIEPAWKMVLSNKLLLAKMWELFPYHPNLLNTSADQSKLSTLGPKIVKKPTLGREGQSVTIFNQEGKVIEGEPGTYEEGDFIYQEFVTLANANGKNAIIGSWIINEVACGMGVRESPNLITNNMGRFVPHLFVE